MLTYSTAFAHAMLGQPNLAIDAITLLERGLSTQLPWLVQACALWKADLLLLSGRRNEALEAAVQELERNSCSLLSESFAGPFARWVALTSECSNNSAAAARVIGELVDRVREYDALDQVEILCAQHFLSTASTRFSGGLPGELADKLEKLPQAVKVQLGRLGMLSLSV
jgi:hypothetical protein